MTSLEQPVSPAILILRALHLLADLDVKSESAKVALKSFEDASNAYGVAMGSLEAGQARLKSYTEQKRSMFDQAVGLSATWRSLDAKITYRPEDAETYQRLHARIDEITAGLHELLSGWPILLQHAADEAERCVKVVANARRDAMDRRQTARVAITDFDICEARLLDTVLSLVCLWNDSCDDL